MKFHFLAQAGNVAPSQPPFERGVCDSTSFEFFLKPILSLCIHMSRALKIPIPAYPSAPSTSSSLRRASTSPILMEPMSTLSRIAVEHMSSPLTPCCLKEYNPPFGAEQDEILRPADLPRDKGELEPVSTTTLNEAPPIFIFTAKEPPTRYASWKEKEGAICFSVCRDTLRRSLPWDGRTLEGSLCKR